MDCVYVMFVRYNFTVGISATVDLWECFINGRLQILIVYELLYSNWTFDKNFRETAMLCKLQKIVVTECSIFDDTSAYTTSRTTWLYQMPLASILPHKFAGSVSNDATSVRNFVNTG